MEREKSFLRIARRAPRPKAVEIDCRFIERSVFFIVFRAVVLLAAALVAPGMTVSAFALLLAQGLPFDLLHAIGNVAFALWMAPVLHRFLADLESTDEVLQTVGDAHVIDG